ncbi:MAG: hypothetical protein QNL05_00190 [Gammaproteobacteria bacterium]|nr:hypothetical protein [Gammaproteobacteria bacterium]
MADSTQELQLSLAITEVNQILEALGQRTYADVYLLVSKIQQQADRQLNERTSASDNHLSAVDGP